MFDTYIFDLDGPLLDGKYRHYQCYADILQSLQFTPLPIDEYWNQKRTGLKIKAILELSGAHGIYDVFIQNWLENIEQKKYLNMDLLQSQVLNILINLKRQHKNIYCVTLRSHAENLYWQLQQLQLLPFFESVIQVKIGENKAEAIKKYLSNDKQILWIGDTEIDYDAAKQLDIPICLLTNGLRDEKYLQKLAPDYLEKDLLSWAGKYNFI